MKKLMVLVTLMSAIVFGCAFNLKPIDVGQVQTNVVKGKTTMAEIETMYGKPYNKGLTNDGITYFYYLSANPLTGSSQDFTFYFDKNGRVSNYSTEYPGGNPLLK